jgi:hypothetical protein
MEKRKLSELTDKELLEESSKMKKVSITNAVLVGVLAGIVIYSIVKNNFGFLALIPLFLAYKLVNNSKASKAELDKLLKDRNLK